MVFVTDFLQCVEPHKEKTRTNFQWNISLDILWFTDLDTCTDECNLFIENCFFSYKLDAKIFVFLEWSLFSCKILRV